MWKKKCATPFLLQFISFPKRQHFSNYDRKIFELTLSIDVNKKRLNNSFALGAPYRQTFPWWTSSFAYDANIVLKIIHKREESPSSRRRRIIFVLRAIITRIPDKIFEQLISQFPCKSLKIEIFTCIWRFKMKIAYQRGVENSKVVMNTQDNELNDGSSHTNDPTVPAIRTIFVYMKCDCRDFIWFCFAFNDLVLQFITHFISFPVSSCS